MQAKTNHQLVIITGHSSGLGQALMHACLQSQVHVLGLARRSAEIQHPLLKQIQVDFSTPKLRIEQVLQPLAAFLEPDAWDSVTLVNNAGGVQPIGMFGALDPDALESTLHINLTLPLLLNNWLLQHFPSQALRIAHISSGASKKVYPGWGIYGASKAGLRMAAINLAAEAERQTRDLRVLLYEPGVLDTAMQKELRQAGPEKFTELPRFLELHKQGQLVKPEDSARELWDYLVSKDLPTFLEVRYGTRSS